MMDDIFRFFHSRGKGKGTPEGVSLCRVPGIDTACEHAPEKGTISPDGKSRKVGDEKKKKDHGSGVVERGAPQVKGRRYACAWQVLENLDDSCDGEEEDRHGEECVGQPLLSEKLVRGRLLAPAEGGLDDLPRFAHVPPSGEEGRFTAPEVVDGVKNYGRHEKDRGDNVDGELKRKLRDPRHAGKTVYHLPCIQGELAEARKEKGNARQGYDPVLGPNGDRVPRDGWTAGLSGRHRYAPYSLTGR